MNIPFPSEDERRGQISAILDRGLTSRRKERFLSVLFALSPRILFFGERDCIFASLIVAFAAYAAAAVLFLQEKLLGALFLFFLSPVVYLLLHGMITLKETQENLRAIPSACRYTPRHLSVMRMLWIGGFGVLLQLPASVMMAASFGGFFRCFSLSLGALFVYASLDLLCVMKLKRWLLRTFLPAGIWFAAFLLHLFLFYGVPNRTFQTVWLVLPDWTAAVFACGALILFLAELFRFYKCSREEDFYAFG